MSLKNILHRYFKPFNINGSIGARELYGASLAAVEIRKVLKIAFPGVKFSVTSKNYDSVRINWTNGPTQKEVNRYTTDFEYGQFNGMTDSYEYTNRNNLPQTKYLFLIRKMSPGVSDFLDKELKDYFHFSNDMPEWERQRMIERKKNELFDAHSFSPNID